MIIIVNAQNDVARDEVGRRLTGGGEEYLEVVNTLRENGRGEDAGVLAHTYMVVKQCPTKG